MGALCSCGGSDSDNDYPLNGNGMAPQDLRGHEFNFYYEYGSELYRAMSFFQHEDGTFGFLLYSGVVVYDSSLKSYKRFSANTVQIEIHADYVSNDTGDFWGGTYFQDMVHNYKISAIFADDEQGIAYVELKEKALDPYGKLYDKTENMIWYFRIDSKEKPDKTFIDSTLGIDNEDNEGEDDENGNEGNIDSGDTDVTSDAISAKVTEVQESEFGPKFIIMIEKNSNTNIPPTVGICVDDSPNPTIDDCLIATEENAYLLQFDNNSTVVPNSTESILKHGTRYYIRPYHTEKGVTTYYGEVSAETLGNTYKLVLEQNPTHSYTISYGFKEKGDYKVGILYYIHTNEGDKYDGINFKKNVTESTGSLVCTPEEEGLTWNDIHWAQAWFKDNETGILYSSEIQAGGAGKETCR